METKNIIITALIGLFGGILIGLIVSLKSDQETYSRKYHLNLNCKEGNIKLLIPDSEVLSFERVLNGSSTITNLEIVIRGKKPISMGQEKP